jgi:hypothetical protein
MVGGCGGRDVVAKECVLGRVMTLVIQAFVPEFGLVTCSSLVTAQADDHFDIQCRGHFLNLLEPIVQTC